MFVPGTDSKGLSALEGHHTLRASLDEAGGGYQGGKKTLNSLYSDLLAKNLQITCFTVTAQAHRGDHTDTGESRV